MFKYAFTEFVSHDVFEISSINFSAFNYRIIYSALLWNYARINKNDDAVNESKVTENVTSRLDGSKISKVIISDI